MTPLLQARDQLVHQRVAAVHERFHQEDAVLLRGRIDHAFGARGVDRHRLLAQHVLPRRDAGERLRLVRRVRRRDVDGLDVRVAPAARRATPPAAGMRNLSAKAARLVGRRADDVDDAAAFGARQSAGAKSAAMPPVPMMPHSGVRSCACRAFGMRSLGREAVNHRVLVGLARLENDLVRQAGTLIEFGNFCVSRQSPPYCSYGDALALRLPVQEVARVELQRRADRPRSS